MHSLHRAWSEAALHAVATPVVIVGAADRVVTFVNRAATKFIGTDAVGSTLREAFGLESGRRMTDTEGRPFAREQNEQSLIARAAAGEPIGPVKALWHGGRGTIALVYYAERVAPDMDILPTVVVSFFDVTELWKVKEALDRSENARDEFVHLAAHELRTPLTSLRLRIDSALRKHADLPSVLAVGHAVDRMTRRIEQLIDVADIHENKVTLRFERGDLGQLVADAARLLEPQARWAKCPVIIAPAPPIFGCWDGPRLTQIIDSLLSNALKFGAGKPVELVPRDEGEEVSVSVIDHGIGVSTGDREVIFERFQRRVPTVHFGGLGLDLWITKEILRQMRGTIALDDTPGGGATFTIRLPKLVP